MDDQNDLFAQPGKEEAAKGSLSQQMRNSVLANDDSLLQCDHTSSSSSFLFGQLHSLTWSGLWVAQPLQGLCSE